MNEPETISQLMDKLENHYDFQCEGGPLRLCVDWSDLRQWVRDLSQPPDSEVRTARIAALNAAMIAAAACPTPEWEKLPEDQREAIDKSTAYSLGHAQGVLSAIHAIRELYKIMGVGK